MSCYAKPVLACVFLILALGGCNQSGTTSTDSDANGSTGTTDTAGSEDPLEPVASVLNCDKLPFVENVYWTTNYGPAGADVLAQATNFVPCNGPAYALCFYSGAPPLTCTLDKERGIAICECRGFQSKSTTYDFFVDINSILNTCVYVETVRDCGHDGADCVKIPNSAPACQYINQGAGVFWPGADMISAFSTATIEGYTQGCTECEGVYAGCMTAPCYLRKNEQGELVVTCECPLFEGPFQVGQDGVPCSPGDGLVWSAAYNINGCTP